MVVNCCSLLMLALSFLVAFVGLLWLVCCMFLFVLLFVAFEEVSFVFLWSVVFVCVPFGGALPSYVCFGLFVVELFLLVFCHFVDGLLFVCCMFLLVLLLGVFDGVLFGVRGSLCLCVRFCTGTHSLVCLFGVICNVVVFVFILCVSSVVVIL